MEELNRQFKIKQDLSISMLAANLYVFVFAMPIVIIKAAIYFSIWDFDAAFMKNEGTFSLFIVLGAMVAGIIVHEYIHGVSWRVFAKLPKDKIKFGFQKETLTPYAHSEVPIKAGAYRWGALMPFIILGEIPAIIGIIYGSIYIFLYGLLFIIAAGGDLAIVWTVRGVNSDNYVQDHPERAGCYELEEAH